MPEDLAASKERVQGSSQEESMARAIRARQHCNLLTGCSPFLREVLRWLEAIEASAATGDRLFVAGDARGPGIAPPALCVPAGFEGARSLDEACHQVVLAYKPRMMQILATEGWPAHILTRRGGQVMEAATGAVEGGLASKAAAAKMSAPEKTCRACAQEFSASWVHRGICCQCEETSRSNGSCPFGARCQPSWFCPHENRCFICDAPHSCKQCRIYRGDGEVVLDIAARLRPTRIALDFDRTLATTRSGGLPVVGQHAVDSDLMSLLWLHQDACAVVTRNSHTEAIRTFLTANGAPEAVPVHSIKRPTSKAERLVPDLGPSECALLVDDSIAELVDPLVAEDSRVHRVLFVRALL